jgi:hypothetical protein
MNERYSPACSLQASVNKDEWQQGYGLEGTI